MLKMYWQVRSKIAWESVRKEISGAFRLVQWYDEEDDISLQFLANAKYLSTGSNSIINQDTLGHNDNVVVYTQISKAIYYTLFCDYCPIWYGVDTLDPWSLQVLSVSLINKLAHTIYSTRLISMRFMWSPDS